MKASVAKNYSKPRWGQWDIYKRLTLILVWLLKKTRPKKHYGAFIPPKILHSRAFNSLRLSASVLIYVHLRRKLIYRKSIIKGKPGKRKPHSEPINSDRLILPYRELEQYWFSRDRIRRGFLELEGAGLIDIKHQGGHTEGDATIYGISDRYLDYGEPQFKSEKEMVPDLDSGVVRIKYKIKMQQHRKKRHLIE